jgi:hypothetical protein
MLFLLSAVFFSSCKKKGCTDINADNLDSSAEKSGTSLATEVTTVTAGTCNTFEIQ